MWRTWRPYFGWKTLCPIWFADPWGLIVTMPLAGATASQEQMEELEEADPNEFLLITAEGKSDDYRWLAGRLVVVDYGLNCEADVSERRTYYRSELERRRKS